MLMVVSSVRGTLGFLMDEAEAICVSVQNKGRKGKGLWARAC
jgi:hypothetical protein